MKLLAKSARKGGGYNVFGLSEGAQKVKKGGFAFLAGEGTLYAEINKAFSNREICSLTLLTNPTWIFDASFLAYKGTPFKDFFRHG